MALVELKRHRLVDLAVSDEVRDVFHRRQHLVLGGPNPLDRLLLLRDAASARRVRVFEPLFSRRMGDVLGLVVQEQRNPDNVHLHPDRLLDLAREVDPLVGLIEELAVARHPRDRL